MVVVAKVRVIWYVWTWTYLSEDLHKWINKNIVLAKGSRAQRLSEAQLAWGNRGGRWATLSWPSRATSRRLAGSSSGPTIWNAISHDGSFCQRGCCHTTGILFIYLLFVVPLKKNWSIWDFFIINYLALCAGPFAPSHNKTKRLSGNVDFIVILIEL